MLQNNPLAEMESLRKIDPEEVAGLVTEINQDGSHRLAFNYTRNGETVYQKWRRTLASGGTGQTKIGGAVPSGKTHFLYNIDCLQADPKDGEPLIFCTGEFDALSYIHAGYRFVVSAPNGDKSLKSAIQDLGDLEKFNNIVASGDAEVSQIIADILVEKFGAWRVGVVRYPEGCKDANDVLMRDGEAAVRMLIKYKLDYYWEETGNFADLPTYTPPTTYDCGILNFNLNWLESELAVIVGPYESGKSTLARILGYHAAMGFVGQEFGSKVSLCTLEDQTYVLQRDMERFHAQNANAYPGVDFDSFSKRVRWVKPKPGGARDLTWYFRMVDIERRRHGVKFFVLDPWSSIGHEYSEKETETKYVERWLNHIFEYVHEHKLILILVTHTSMRVFNDDGTTKRFRIGQAAGTVQFGNKMDRGICVWRSQKVVSGRDHTIISFDKTKDNEVMGKKAIKAFMYFPESQEFVLDLDATKSINGS